MQIQGGDGRPFPLYVRDQLRREVQPRRRSGDAAVVGGVDGLVALPVGGGREPMDVGRQRHFPVAGERATGVQGADEADAPQSPAQHLHDLHGAVVAENDPPTRLELAARVAHGEPGAVRELAHQEQLGPASTLHVARLPLPVEASRNHSRRIEH